MEIFLTEGSESLDFDWTEDDWLVRETFFGVEFEPNDFRGFSGFSKVLADADFPFWVVLEGFLEAGDFPTLMVLGEVLLSELDSVRNRTRCNVIC